VLVTFNELAERELNDATQYYEHEQPGLGVGFLTEARRTVEALTEHPEAGTLLLRTVR
jgi:plasmid stabilization system protein ParE